MPDKVYIVDTRYFDEINHAFRNGRLFLGSVPCPSLPDETAYHPDMVLFPVAPGCVICAPEVYDAYHRILSPLGVQLVQGTKALGRDYPKDIAYNVLSTPSCAFARFQSTDPLITNLLDECGIRRYDVAQGYARCSSIAFENCLITADPSLAAAGKKAGLEILEITPGHIELPGYDYGFIGGASGIIDDSVAFFGDLSFHPDGDKIRQFIKNHGFSVQEIPGRMLCDIGTILCIEL